MPLMNARAVRCARENKGWTQEKLAEEAKLGTGVIKKAESWKSVDAPSFRRIANALSVGPDTLRANQNPKGIRPNPPDLILGRNKELAELKDRLYVGKSKKPDVHQVLTVMRGWPGVGKSTLASTLANDMQVLGFFSDAVLWTSLGPEPDLFDHLMRWGRAVGLHEDILLKAKTIDEISAQLRVKLLGKSALFIIDDVWDPLHAEPFIVGGSDCATLIITRETQTAEKLATPDDIYILGVLSDKDALELLKEYAKTVVTKYEDRCRNLVNELEGLPLSIRVAGRLLHKEQHRGGFAVDQLITDLREGVALLQAKPPVNLLGVPYKDKAMLTVKALLDKSTDLLDPEVRKHFALLGPQAPKPAKFDLEDMADQWQADDAVPTVRELIDRGLLEPVEEEGKTRYQMHALLIAHANALLDSYE